MTFKLLVLEDDANLRDALAEVLSEQGYEVVSASRGEEAVRCAAREPFDLIVSDIRMEGLDGLAAIEEAQRYQPGIGSLVVSGWASEAETLRAIQLNVGAYLRKPFTMDAFLSKVRELLARRADERGRRQQLQVLRRSLLWALEALARTADAAGLGGEDLLPRAALAGRLAEGRDLPVELRELLRVGALMAPLQTLPQAKLPPFAGQEPLVLAPLQQLLQDTSSLPGRILAFVLASPEHRGQVDAGLAELAAQLPAGEETAPSLEVLQGLHDPARLERSLLALARTLEEAQDSANAARAYQEILARNQPSAAAVAAALGLAALARAEGKVDAAVAWARQAVELGRELGPVAAAQAHLQAGLLLRGHPQAEPWLHEAHTEARRLGLGAEAAQCAVLLGLDERREAGRLLLQAGQTSELLAALPWLAEPLLALGLPEASRLVTELAAPLARLLPHFSRETRATVLALLEGRTAPAELLEVLLADPDPSLRQRAVGLQGKTSAPLLRLQSMGFFQVFTGAVRVPESRFKSQKVKYFLAYLAAQGGRFVPEDQLIEEFWPELPGRGKRNLYATTSELRRCLGNPDVVVRERDTLGLNPAVPRWHDLDELQAAYDRSDWLQVARLAQGPYLDGTYLEWAVRQRAVWESRVGESLCRLAGQLADARRYQEALEYATRALGVEPLRQEAHLLKMRGHLGLGQPELAVRQFEHCERLLQREYAGEPTIELLTVYQRARHGLGDSAAG